MKITIEKSGSAFYGEVQNRSIKLREIDIINYPKVENLSTESYDLVSYDNNGNIIKSQHCLIKHKGTNMSKIIVDSKWVKAGVNVQKGDVLVIRSEGELIASQMDATKKDWHFNVELPDGSIKDAKFNKISVENLTSGFGTNDSAEWLGKEIIVDDIVKYAKGAGCIYAVKK